LWRFALAAILLRSHWGKVLQRLFSTFANGWPGVGLLLQRVLTTTLLVRFGIIELADKSFSLTMIPQLIAASVGILLLVGLWTPVAGSLIAAVELWIAFVNGSDPWIAIALATLGATIAMIGPGAWSIDARLFGRKHITT
jgi:putative oxidoreductase